jgi:hypothetical protein
MLRERKMRNISDTSYISSISPQVKLSVLPGRKGSGKTESDGSIRKNQSTGLVTSFLFLFQLKTET